MFATIDAFVMWLVKQPSVPFWVGYICNTAYLDSL